MVVLGAGSYFMERCGFIGYVGLKIGIGRVFRLSRISSLLLLLLLWLLVAGRCCACSRLDTCIEGIGRFEL